MNQVMKISLKAHIKCSDFVIAQNLVLMLRERGIEARSNMETVIVDAQHATLAKRLRTRAW